MARPQPDEKVIEDAMRIHALVQSGLQFVAATDGGWSQLFLDPVDGRLWEHTHPQSHMHGGGPPRLATISDGDA